MPQVSTVLQLVKPSLGSLPRHAFHASGPASCSTTAPVFDGLAWCRTLSSCTVAIIVVQLPDGQSETPAVLARITFTTFGATAVPHSEPHTGVSQSPGFGAPCCEFGLPALFAVFATRCLSLAGLFPLRQTPTFAHRSALFELQLSHHRHNQCPLLDATTIVFGETVSPHFSKPLATNRATWHADQQQTPRCAGSSTSCVATAGTLSCTSTSSEPGSYGHAFWIPSCGCMSALPWAGVASVPLQDSRNQVELQTDGRENGVNTRGNHLLHHQESGRALSDNTSQKTHHSRDT